MLSIEWHNVGEWRFGWVARRESSRFTVLRRHWWWWVLGRTHEFVTQGVVEYGLEPRERVVPQAGARLTVVFVTDGGYELDLSLIPHRSCRRKERGRSRCAPYHTKKKNNL